MFQSAEEIGFREPVVRTTNLVYVHVALLDIPFLNVPQTLPPLPLTLHSFERFQLYIYVGKSRVEI